jgi:hypothetical protein
MLRKVARLVLSGGWSRSLQSIGFVIVCAVGVFTSPIDVVCQAGCGSTAVNVSTPLPQGFFSVSSPTACTLPDGGYLKINTSLRVDTKAEITGTCDIKYWDISYATCYYLYTTTLPLNWVTITTSPPTQPPSVDRAWAQYASQSLDTRSGQGLNTTPTQEGQYLFSFQSQTGATNCTDPTTSNTIVKRINVTQCKPTWFVNPDNTINYHAPLGDITIAVPVGYGAAQAPAEAAAAAWSTALGRSITVKANSTCSAGDPLCVQLKNDHGSDELDTGCASQGTASYNSAGEWIGATSIRFMPDWSGAHPDVLQRIIAHELGHYFGLFNRLDASCGSADTVMGYSPTACYSTTAPPEGTLLGPSASDTFVIQNSVYGDNVRTTCGW